MNLLASAHRNSWRWLAAAAIGLGAVALLAATATSPRPDGAGAAGAASVTGRAPGADGLRVFVDPEHGGVKPATAEDLAAVAPDLAAKMSRSSAGLTLVQRADGSKHVDLQGRFQSVSVATVDAEGHARVESLESPAAVAQRLQGQAPPSQWEVK